MQESSSIPIIKKSQKNLDTIILAKKSKKVIPPPLVDDIIFVPESIPENSPIASKFFGGEATVNRVICTSFDPPQHYVYVTEHTGYKEYKWENDLAEKQDALSAKYSNKERAYIKTV